MSSSETAVNGNVQGPVQSGSFQAPVQTTTVQLIRESLQEELPEELQNTTLRQMILAHIKATQNLEDRIYERDKRDEQERLERQKETDYYRSQLSAYMRDIGARVARVEYAMVFLVAALALAGSLIFLVAMK